MSSRRTIMAMDQARSFSLHSFNRIAEIAMVIDMVS
jgi:hypothetical protein